MDCAALPGGTASTRSVKSVAASIESVLTTGSGAVHPTDIGRVRSTAGSIRKRREAVYLALQHIGVRAGSIAGIDQYVSCSVAPLVLWRGDNNTQKHRDAD